MSLVVGCSSTKKTDAPSDQSAQNQQQATNELPDDSAAPVAVVDDDGLITQYLESTTTLAAPPASQPAVLRVLEDIDRGQGIAIDAMVGQVNGQPIYANEVFELIDEQLTVRGHQLPRQDFYNAAKGIIFKRLEAMIIEALILGESERNLSEQEHFGLGEYLNQKKAELIRLFGQGSAILADTRLREDSGISLSQRVEEIRSETLVKKYTHEKILPQINVSRKDIKRYYKNHYDEFNPKPGRTIHLIRAGNIEIANRIDKLLLEGKPFLEIAADKRLNEKEPDKQGFFLNSQSSSFFGRPEIDKQVLALKEGEHTPRVKLGTKYCWIYIKSLSTGESQSLGKMQSQIESKLRTLQYERLTARFYNDLRLRGSYDSPLEMADRLMEVAMNRYAQPR